MVVEIPWNSILRGLPGVAAAIRAPDDKVKHIVSSVTATLNNNDATFELQSWHNLLANIDLDEDLRHWANLAVAVAFLI
jgi:hypothetical protein